LSKVVCTQKSPAEKDLQRFIEDTRLRFLKICTLSASIALAACAGNRATSAPDQDYVEIDNPTATMSPDAPAKIWVPRSYVEKGVPRGSELIKKGTEKVVQGFSNTTPQAQQEITAQQATSAGVQPIQAVPASPQSTGANTYPVQQPESRQTMAASPREPYGGSIQSSFGAGQSVKNRIAILESDGRGLDQPLYEYLRRSSVGGILDSGQSKMLAQSATLTSDADKSAFAIRLQQDYGVNVVIYLSAPDGVEAGKGITGEVYDAMGGGQLQKFDGVISQEPHKDQSGSDIASLPETFTGKIRELLALLPWYGRITAVDGNRAYIAAGREAGLRIGQTLKIYKNGRYMKGLGFAPGEQVGTLSLQGFVGPNGSFGTIKEGQGIEATDLVAVE
jgi:hypothetical protein